MKKHFSSNWFIYLIGIPFIYFSFKYPQLKIEMSGGFAWAGSLIMFAIGGSMIYIGLFGGEISYSSKGLRGWFKEFREQKERHREEIEALRRKIINEEPRHAMTLMQYNALSNRRIKRLIKDMKKDIKGLLKD